MRYEPQARGSDRVAEQVVRHIAAGTGFTTIIAIGRSADGVTVLTHDSFSANSLDASYGHLLQAAARAERNHPRGAPAYACALVLPERDVAYLHYTHEPTAPARVLTVGRNPVNDPGTHVEVTDGLADLMLALQETQPPHQPTGRAYLTQSGSRLLIVPDPPIPHRPRGYQGRHR